MITIDAEKDTCLQPRLLSCELRKLTQQFSDTLTYNLATQQFCVVPGLGEFELKIIAGHFYVNPKTMKKNYRRPYYQLRFTPSPRCLARIKQALDIGCAIESDTIDTKTQGLNHER